MKVYTNIQEFTGVEKPIVTIGTFDGVHIGHKKIISRLTEVASKEGGETVLLTFFPHPRMVLFPDDNDLKLISTQKEKIALLEKEGVDHLIITPFDKSFSRLSAAEYVREILVNQLNVFKVVIGYDHHFGRNREGDLEQLKELAKIYDFGVEEIPAQMISDTNISSTKARKALLAGDVTKANSYLGHPFELSGTVVLGKQLGRKIGFPTANIKVAEKYKLIPKKGAYAVTIQLQDGLYNGMLNIGDNPTVDKEETTVKIEVHIFDFYNEIYNETIHLSLMHRIRDEKKFENIDELQKQLELDKIQALNKLA